MFTVEMIETDNETFMALIDPEMTQEELADVKKELKISLYQSLAKLFYKSLTDLLKQHEDLGLNTVLYFITLFETDMDKHIHFSSSSYYEKNREYMKEYITLQNSFFSAVAIDYGLETDALKTIFDSYGLKTASGDNNYDLSFLTEEKQAYINSFMLSLKDSGPKKLGEAKRILDEAAYEAQKESSEESNEAISSENP